MSPNYATLFRKQLFPLALIGARIVIASRILKVVLRATIHKRQPSPKYLLGVYTSAVEGDLLAFRDCWTRFSATLLETWGKWSSRPHSIESGGRVLFLAVSAFSVKRDPGHFQWLFQNDKSSCGLPCYLWQHRYVLP